MSATRTEREIKLPHNAEYERLILGAAMVAQKPDYWLEVSDQLRPADFFVGSNRAIYGAYQALALRGEDLTPLTLSDELARRGELDGVGGPAYLASLIDGVPGRVRFDTEIRRLKDLSAKRQLARFSSSLLDQAQADEDLAEDLLERAERTIGEMRGGTSEDELIDSATAIDRTLAELKGRWDRPEDARGVLTGFCDVDYMLHGLRPGRVHLLAARPGEGKTTWALNVAHNASRHHRNQRPVILVVSLEMPITELMTRALSTATRIDSDRLYDGNLSRDERRLVDDAAAELRGLSVSYLEPRSSLLVSSVRAEVQKLQRRHGHVDLVIIDYVQLLSPARQSPSENDRLTEISRAVKMLALSHDVPMLVLAQMNREIEKRAGNKEPQLSDLRGSGSLEQDADVVMFLHNETDYADSVERRLLVRKHRGGKTGSVPLLWFKGESRFESAVRD